MFLTAEGAENAEEEKREMNNSDKYQRSKCRRKRGSSLSVFFWLQVPQSVCKLLMSLLPPRARGMI